MSLLKYFQIPAGILSMHVSVWLATASAWLSVLVTLYSVIHVTAAKPFNFLQTD